MSDKKKFLLINVVILVLEIIWGSWSYIEASKQPHHMAGLVWFFIVLFHFVISVILALIFLVMGQKKLARYFGLLALAILVIGFSVCGVLAM